MVSFFLCLLALVAGYFFYGRYVERLFGPDNRPTPVCQHADGIDYIRLSRWKMFMIQFLNIAGVGPIFGAIMGIKFGASCFLWIVLGSVFAGAVHDYLAAMMSLRRGGISLPETIGHYLGHPAMHFVRVFTILLLILVGAVFVSSPAGLLDTLTGGQFGINLWIALIFVYYMLAAVLPVDKIIGRIYPLFAVALLFMAGGILAYLVIQRPAGIPELWDGLGNTHPQAAITPIVPILFVSVACGAISGFHATQSPMMARCMGSEFQGRPVFYGAMIVEGIVALIWAAAAAVFFHQSPENMAETNAAGIVFGVTREWLGPLGGLLAVLGVVAAPITTGDTALRSARLIVADILGIEQAALSRRLAVSLVIFAATFVTLYFSLANKDGFNIIWRYFAWANQTLSVFTLWAITVYLARERKNYFVTLIPAVFMSGVVSTYIFVARECLGFSLTIGYTAGAAIMLASAAAFFRWKRRSDARVG